MDANTINVNIRYTFDGTHYTEETRTVAQASIQSTLVNALGGMSWWWSETMNAWQLSDV